MYQFFHFSRESCLNVVSYLNETFSEYVIHLPNCVIRVSQSVFKCWLLPTFPIILKKSFSKMFLMFFDLINLSTSLTNFSSVFREKFFEKSFDFFWPDNPIWLPYQLFVCFQRKVFWKESPYQLLSCFWKKNFSIKLSDKKKGFLPI